ncbi:MAG: homoserine dehydrogenase [Alphaproteobacteria bacterium]|nr:homoserine dehydrogenase [Alphaproteobacteria bacterium]
MSTREGALRIGVAGLGTVGGGLLKLLAARGARGGERPLEVVAVSARNRSRKRDVDISRYAWADDPVQLAADPNIDIFVELIGGSDGPAKRAVEVALQRGAHVVTANKALLAEHGADLARLSEKTGGQIAFEAAVGGGMPIVKAIKESLAGCDVGAIAGVLNGTCNYLLTEMEASGRSFADVLADAQRLGYAEADPTMDVGGFDAGHKIALLAAIGFGAAPDFQAVEVEGVENVTLTDIRLAGKLGYRIKLVAKAERRDGRVDVSVAPRLLAFDHPLARIDGPLNAAVVDADPVGRLTFVGRGAGEGPTASAVAADLIDLALGVRRPVFGRPIDTLSSFEPIDRAHEHGRYYLRLLVKDRPGVIAAVSDRLGRAGVSIESILQQPTPGADAVPIVLTTQSCARTALDSAVAEIGALDAMTEPPRVMRVEDKGSWV